MKMISIFIMRFKMTIYNTKQSQIILDFLKRNSNKDLTAEQILQYVNRKEKICGLTTVYRQLKNLVSENKIKKYYIANNSSCFYQYISDDECHEHLHFKCEKCGKTLHLEKFNIQDINSTLSKQYNILVDTSKTVLYGLCNNCQK